MYQQRRILFGHSIGFLRAIIHSFVFCNENSETPHDFTLFPDVVPFNAGSLRESGGNCRGFGLGGGEFYVFHIVYKVHYYTGCLGLFIIFPNAL